jgi:hypothetical protein
MNQNHLEKKPTTAKICPTMQPMRTNPSPNPEEDKKNIQYYTQYDKEFPSLIQNVHVILKADTIIRHLEESYSIAYEEE